MDLLKSFRMFKDELTLIISIVALVVSGVSIYLQFREIDSVALRLVDIDTAIENKGNAIFKVVLTNSGTLPYLISEIRMVVSENASGAGASYPTDGATLAKETPFVLEKGKMRLITVSVPVSSLVGTPEKAIPAYLGAWVTSVDINGELHHADLWLASVCVDSEILLNTIPTNQKISLTYSGKSFFETNNRKPCN